MKICHITTVHPVKDSRIFYRMCRGLAARHMPVTLLAPESFKEEPFLRPSQWNRRLGQVSRPRRVGVALRAALAENAGLYHFHDPELIPMALTLKALRPFAAVVYDVHEDYPSMMLEKYWLPRRLRPAASSGIGVAHWAAGKFLDGIVTADIPVAEDFAQSAAGRVFCFYNFPSLAVFNAGKPEPVALPADLIYLGGMSERSGIFVLLDALSQLARDGLRPTVRLAGYTDGDKGRAQIVDAIRARSLGRQIELGGRIPHAQVPDWICAGRIGLVLLQALPKFQKNIPSKMFEYWACGLAVVASDLAPARRFLTAGENGLFFKPGDAGDLAAQLRCLLANPDLARAFGRAGQQRVESDWNNELQIAGLIAFYRRIAHSVRAVNYPGTDPAVRADEAPSEPRPTKVSPSS